jgi:hypothetical protein
MVDSESTHIHPIEVGVDVAGAVSAKFNASASGGTAQRTAIRKDPGSLSVTDIVDAESSSPAVKTAIDDGSGAQTIAEIVERIKDALNADPTSLAGMGGAPITIDVEIRIQAADDEGEPDDDASTASSPGPSASDFDEDDIT